MIEVQTVYVFHVMQHVRGMQGLEVPMKKDGSLAPGNVSCLGDCERDTQPGQHRHPSEWCFEDRGHRGLNRRGKVLRYPESAWMYWSR